MEGQRVNSKIFCKTIILSFLVLFGFSFWGCITLPKEIYVPLNADVEGLRVYKKIPVRAALLISEEDKNYVYKGTPSGFRLSNIVHVFPLGEALEKDSVQIFSQIFRGVQVVRTPAEAQNFKIVIAPKMEDFSFRYDEGGISFTTTYIIPTAAIKVKTTVYSAGTRIWERSVKSPEQTKRIAYYAGFTNENEMGEVASQALIYVLKKIAEELVQDPEVEENAGSISIDGLTKTYAQQKRRIPLRQSW
jgi:hypothetical protein